MNRTIRIFVAVLLVPALALSLAGCGTGGTEDCPPVDGEQHIARANVDGTDGAVMLHQIGRMCPVVGDNEFRLYFQPDPDMEMAMAPAVVFAHQTADGMGFPVTVVSFDPVMPSMGHGTAVPPVIDAADPGRVSITFQMPGDWQIRAEVEPAAGVTAQATFDIVVH